MNLDFSDFQSVLADDEFDERPVVLEEFLYSKDYLGFPKLSQHQLDIVRIGSQIYKEHTLIDLFGIEQGRKLWSQNKKELIMMLGKGSGKDALSTIICAYVVYQLLCLKDPAEYYGKPAGDAIDIINVAINADQAANVFFKGFKTRIKKCPWFAGKYQELAKSIKFNKEITVYSGNSEAEATEGYNILLAVLDEIDGFDEGKNPELKKGEDMYNTLSATVSSRFDDVGKVLMLSWPRQRDGFIMKHYNANVAEKNVILRKETLKLDESLPDGIIENEVAIEWEEDHIVSYKFSNVWALRRPTWEVNPTKTINSFISNFYSNMTDALGRFACTPDEHGDGTWFRDKAKIDATFVRPNGLSDVTGHPSIVLRPEEDKRYYIHVDLARVQDNCAIAMAHVDKFQKAIFDQKDEISPFVIVDLVRYWKPDRSRPIDFSDVREFIISLQRAKFNIKLVTFDRWNSDLTIEQLNSVGIQAEKLSVGRDHYSELALTMGQNMLSGPDVDLLRKELKKLVVLPNGNVDHTNKSSKDLSDAVCGAVYNASVHTPREGATIEIMTYQDILDSRRQNQVKEAESKLIKAPAQMPGEIEDWLSRLKIV
jgi:hypothetical protein